MKQTKTKTARLLSGACTIVTIVTACSVILLARITSAQTVSYTDNFESPTLNPFWRIIANAGSVTVPSTAQAHSGSNSVQFNSLSNAGQKGIYLRHDLEQPSFGQISVWFYDNGAGVGSANYLTLTASGPNGGMNLFTQDYDFGPGTDGHYYKYDATGVPATTTALPRSQGWHQFAINTQAGSVTLSVDGTAVYSGAADLPVSSFAFGMYGPTWRPAWTTSFDDFQATLVHEPRLSIRVSQVELCWTSITNATYRVDYRSDLTTNTWLTLSNCVPSAGIETCIYDRVPRGQPQRFYRVVATNCVPGI